MARPHLSICHPHFELYVPPPSALPPVSADVRGTLHRRARLRHNKMTLSASDVFAMFPKAYATAKRAKHNFRVASGLIVVVVEVGGSERRYERCYIKKGNGGFYYLEGPPGLVFDAADSYEYEYAHTKLTIKCIGKSHHARARKVKSEAKNKKKKTRKPGPSVTDPAS